MLGEMGQKRWITTQVFNNFLPWQRHCTNEYTFGCRITSVNEFRL